MRPLSVSRFWSGLLDHLASLAERLLGLHLRGLVPLYLRTIMMSNESTPKVEPTHEQVQPKSTLLSLPYEILELTTAHASLRDLKSLRSTCKQFSASTDPALFHTIVIVPCLASFRVITASPYHDRISGHVRRLFYDDRWPDVAARIRNNLQRVNSDSLNPTAKARLLQRLDLLTQITKSFNGNAVYEVACLKQVLDLLPSLRTVSVFSTHEHDNSAKLPAFYSRLCFNSLCEINEASLLPANPHHSERGRSALLAIRQSVANVTDIHMNGLSWLYMFHSTIQSGIFPADVLATVKSLHLSFDHTQHDLLLRGKTQLARLGTVLSQAIHLGSLRLDFGDDTAQDAVDEVEGLDGRSWCMLLALFPSEHRYPHLRELDLQNFRFSEPGLLAFLDRHAGTIKSLRLNSVELVAGRRSRSPCWRRVFIHLQSALDLHEVQLQDGLYISGGGVWISMHPKPEERFPGCLLDRVEEFILHRGECPIRAGYHDLKWTDLNGLGDDSWAFY